MSKESSIRFSAPASSPVLDRAERRARGAYYTPPELVELVLGLTLPDARCGDTNEERRLLDPACGAGEFLIGAACWLAVRGETAALVGLDIDPPAVEAARERLQQEGVSADIRVGDALDKTLLPDASFDVIVGNPPFLNIRELARSHGAATVERLRRQFQTARGNFDLYILFLERALALLKPGGRCGLVLPNKWATLDYARSCRELLLAQATIEQVVDLSGVKAFAQANVYPHVLVFRKAVAGGGHTIRCWSPHLQATNKVVQRALAAESFGFAGPLQVEDRVATEPLGQLASLSCGTAGFAAGRIASRLIDGVHGRTCEPKPTADFITSGNIDRYAIRLGHVRFLGREYRRPRLPLDCPELTAAKRRLFAEPKIVVAGMSRRLEAAFDRRGLALGVQVFAVHQAQVDAFVLLALLNSKLLTYLFATRFAGKRLGGGYLAVNKGQLARLPIRTMTSGRNADWTRFERLCEAAQGAQPPRPAVDAEIDRLVYELYRLSQAEVERVEGYFERLVPSQAILYRN